MANDEQAQAVIDWVNGAPLGELATELMAAFAPRAAGRQATGVYLNHLGAWLFVATPVRRGTPQTWSRRCGRPCSCWSTPNWST